MGCHLSKKKKYFNKIVDMSFNSGLNSVYGQSRPDAKEEKEMQTTTIFGMKFTAVTDKNELFKYEDQQEVRLWSPSQPLSVKVLNKATNTANTLRIVFRKI
jgi:hypothetical protein